MATITWIGSSNNAFNLAANWSPATVPTGASSALITKANALVISSVDNTVATLAMGATGTLEIAGGSFSITANTASQALAGQITITDGNSLSLGGAIVNSGTIFADGIAATTQITFTKTTNTLSGGGKIILSNNPDNLISGAASADLLNNLNNTISGAGDLGNGQLTLINQHAGVIDATQPTSLFVDTGNAVTNLGTMEATAGGTLDIYFNDPVTNTGGTIAASGAGAVVILQAAVSGGTVTASGGGMIATSGSSGAALDGRGLHSLTIAGGPIRIGDGNALTLLGTIINNGTINLNGSSSTTALEIGSPVVTLQGTGTVHLADNANNNIFADAGNFELINQSNTISGSGQLGDAELTFVNRALVDANQTTALALNTSGEVAINAGTMQATGTGGLVIQNTAVNNAGGTIQAMLAGAHIDLDGGTIEGGTLATANGGVIQTNTGNNGELDGITAGALTNKGLIRLDDESSLTLAGTINNTGTIFADQVANSGSTDLDIESETVTLQGGGTLLLSNNAGNTIFTSTTGDRLVNVDNTISGAGNIGDGDGGLAMLNQGLINATQSAALTIDIAALSSAQFANPGIMEATSTAAVNGGLVIQDTAVNNAGGTIQALGLHAHVDLNDSRIEGGVLTTSGTAVIQTLGSGDMLDGITAGALANKGTLLVTNGTTLTLAGVINNTGTISEHATNATGTAIGIAGQTTTLTGAGAFLMTDNANNIVFGNGASTSNSTLVNQGNTISGAGQFGDGGMQFVNAAGSIVATGTKPLVIDLGTGTGVNGASMNATGVGGMVLAGGIFTNNGSMTAGDGSAITFQSAAINANLAGGELVGGTWRAIAAGHGATLSMTGGPIVTDAATLVLQGAVSTIRAGTGAGATPYTRLEQSLTTIAATGELDVLGARGYAGTTNLNVAGTLVLAGGTFHTASLAVASGGLFSGFGTVTDAIANAGLIRANTGSPLTITGNLSGSGTLEIDAGAMLTLNGTSNTVGVVLDAGTLTLGGGLFHANSVTLLAGGSLIAAGTVTETGAVANAGLIEVAAGKVLALNGAVTGVGTLQSDTGGNLALAAGGGNTAGAVVDNGLVGLSGTLVVGGNVSGTGTLNVSPGATLTLNGVSNAIGTLQDNGTVILGASGSFNAGSVIVGSGAQFTAAGTITEVGAIANSGRVEVGTNDLLALNGTVTGSGSLQSDAGGNLALEAMGNTAGTVVDNGLIGIAGALVVSGTVSGTGTLNVSPGATLTLNGASNTIGTVQDNGTLVLGGASFHAGAITVGSGAQLTAAGTITEVGAIANSGRIEVNANDVLALNGNVTGSGTLQVDSGANLGLDNPTNSAGTVLNNGIFGLTGTVDVTGSVNPASTGVFVLSPAALLELAADTGANNKISFIVSGANGELAIDAVAQFGTHVGQTTYAGPLLENFGATASIDLKNLVFPGATLDSYSQTTGLLQLHSGTTLATLAFQNSTLHNASAGLAGFHVGADGTGHTLLTHS